MHAVREGGSSPHLYMLGTVTLLYRSSWSQQKCSRSECLQKKPLPNAMA